MANDAENVSCFLRQVPCPKSPDPTSSEGDFVCRAWDGTRCILLTLAEVVADEFLKSRVITTYPESAPPPRIKS